MTTESTNTTLFAKLAAVMGEVRTLEKTGRNQYDKYDYVTADAIAHRIGKVLASYKLALLPSMVSVETNEYTTQKGGTNFRTVCNFQMTFACGDTGATWTSLWSGEAIDRSDKSISKAAVNAVKYFLLKTFLLSGGDEDDAAGESPAIEIAQTPATRTHPEGSRPWYTAARNSTENGVRKLCDTCLELHHTGGPASTGPNGQYGYLVGLLDSVVKQATGAKDGHKRVLPVLCQAEISKDNPPSAALAGRLLERLATHIKDANGEPQDNPEYSQPVADAMIVIYRAAESMGTPSLLST